MADSGADHARSDEPAGSQGSQAPQAPDDATDRPFPAKGKRRARRAERREAKHQARAARTPTRRSRWWLLPEALVLLLVVGAGLAWHFRLGDKLGISSPDPLTEPAAVRPPAGLDLPRTAPARAVAAGQDDGDASAARLKQALDPLLGDRRLGRVTVRVADLSSGRVVYQRGDQPFTPASTTKLLTSTAALQAIGPGKRFATRVEQEPAASGTPARLTLVGGGDPFLASGTPEAGTYPHYADVGTLARRTAAALKQGGTTRVTLGYDDSLFTGPRVDPSWESSYVPEGVVPPISALWVDEGRSPAGGYVDDPSARAATVFRQALGAAGITVSGDVRRQPASQGATEVARVESPPLGQIVSRLLLVSDNNAAEVVSHQVGLAEGTGGSFSGGAKAVIQVLGRLGVPTAGLRLLDGSGLSRGNLISPETMVGVLRTAASDDHPTLREVVTGLPVAGFTGSLTDRFDTGPAAGRGRVHAKTGTLTGVHGLAGIATDLSGDVLAFVAIADRVPEADQLFARQRIDQVAAAIGACRCGTSATPSASPSPSASG
ncbi:D-alanyl-D-alanine carboxypeptidase [Marmoricola endophyticus]|uniref:D-alanyl-D-alanine carboxypeptidase n=1 Tax=Marmoricola endophyticus TaxID=2040280 RepID=A0A917BNI0_9ACTN|nr:D-alanyl-D-alanine carboxypeptidase/D-alanyl-D-alanine-endopeptidase [Marmoricola endophyticus]GGF50832.1 D-alanyl-D-alanine carboxypeptidase [Marmoricola endophyticus]